MCNFAAVIKAGIYLISDIMKGLQQYIQKYGRHFTDNLAQDICERWNVSQVEKGLKRKVYYNVSSSTLGDIAYLSNIAYVEYPRSSHNCKSKCIDFALGIVGNVNGNGTAFSIWLGDMVMRNKHFDFSNYV